MNCNTSDLPVLQYLPKFANGINSNHNEMLVDTDLTCQGHCASMCPLETPQQLSETGPVRIHPLPVGRLPPREWRTQPMKPQSSRTKRVVWLWSIQLSTPGRTAKPHLVSSHSRAALYALTQQWQGTLERQREHLSRRSWAFHHDTWGGGCVAHSISKTGWAAVLPAKIRSTHDIQFSAWLVQQPRTEPSPGVLPQPTPVMGR